MSKQEIERFIGDLKGDSALLDEVKSGAAGLSAVVETAKAKGYDITLDDAKAYISEKAGQELSDQQLDAVAGGKRDHKKTQEAVAVAGSSVEAVYSDSTVATGAEVATLVVAVAEVVLT